MSTLKNLVEEARSRTLKILNYDTVQEDRGLALHRASIICDSLLSPPYITPYSKNMAKKAKEMIKLGRSSGEIGDEMNRMRNTEIATDKDTCDEYLGVWKAAGVTCASQTVAINNTLAEAVDEMARNKLRIDKLRDFEFEATCVKDIKRAKREGKHAYLWNFQDSLPLGGGIDVDRELDNIDLFYGLGLRVIQLTYNRRNFVGDGCTERYESGLTDFGLLVIERMNKLGMLVDVSHCGYQTTMDAIEASKVPVAATHTICKKVYPHTRGKTDEEMKAIVERGGYVGICQLPQFIGGKGTIKEFLDHVDHAVEVVGVDHVGIGTDMKYRSNEPQELINHRRPIGASPRVGRSWWGGFRRGEPFYSIEFTPEMTPDETTHGSLAWFNWPYFTVGLVTRGYSDQEIEKIIGGNFLRLLENVIG